MRLYVVYLLAVGMALAPIAATAAPDLAVQQSDILISNSSPEASEVFQIQVNVRNIGTNYFDQSTSVPVLEHSTAAAVQVSSTALSNNQWWAQKLVPPNDLYVSRLDIALFDRGTDDDVRLVLRDDNSGSPASTALSSVTVNSSNTDSTTPADQVFNLPAPLFLTAGTTYWFSVESTNTITNGYGLWTDTNSSVNQTKFSPNQGTGWNNMTHLIFRKVYRPQDTIVRFYDGNPSTGGTLFHVSTISLSIAASSSAAVSISTSFASAGAHSVYVEIDGGGLIAEVDESNNKAFQTITVLQPGPQVLSASMTDGDQGVDPQAAMTFTFNRFMSTNSLSGAFSLTTLKDNLGQTVNAVVSGTLTYNGASKTATFTPNTTLNKNYQYQAAFSALALDTTGFALNPYSAAFVTATSNDQLNTFVGGDAQTKVVLSSGAVSTAAFYVAIETAPSSAAAVLTAEVKASQDGDAFRYPLSSTLRKLTLYQGTNPGIAQASTNFSGDVTLTIPYSDDGNGYVAGASPRVMERNLAMHWLNETDGLWVRLPDAAVDTAANTVTARVPHFSYFVLMGANAPDVSEAHAYPVPFQPSKGHQRIKFTGLSPQCVIKIYSAAGELVKTIEEADGDGFNDTWDATGAASGTYVYIIDNGAARKTGHLVIVK